MQKQSVLITSIAVLACLPFSCDAPPGGSAPAALKPNAIKVEFFVMSQCPHGVTVENAVKPALDKLAGYIDFNLEYIVTPQPDGSFKSLHGQPEVDGNIAQLCARKVSPAKYLDFIECQNKSPKEIPGNWQSCATQLALDVPSLQACKDGPEGKALLTASAAKATLRKARGSPTIFVADKPYRGGRRADDFLRAFCAAIQGEPPQACAAIPPPPKVKVLVLVDQRCKDRACQSLDGALGQLGQTFPGLESKKIDYATEEGKALYASASLKHVPALLFDKSLDQDQDGLRQIGRFLKPAGEYRSLAMGAAFDPTAEICDNKQDDTGNGKVDCDDETCSETLVCRKEMPKRLDLFVMSQCPYGVKALDAMPEVLANFKGEVDFHVNFIADAQGDGFRSLHGQPEVDENIRELCAITHYPKDHRYMDYILCRNKNIRSPEWQSCATGEIKAEVIDKCFTGGEGKKLFGENIKLASALKIGGSPTWIANNRHQFSGIDSESVRRNFCQHNPGTANCDKTLTTVQARGGECGK